MKKTLFLLTFLFAMVTVVMNTNDVYAYSETSNEEDIMPMYVTIQNTSTSLTSTDSGVCCKASKITKAKTDIKITMRLQKQSGTSWSTVKIWTSSGSSVTSLILTKNYTVTSGTYRVKATMEAGSESQTVISKSCTK